MSSPPPKPKIYHITHVDNLPGIVAAGGLRSDALIVREGGPAQSIGLSDIKRRRLTELAVGSHPGTMVGDYVPFYFCPRSVMLYVIHRANHPQLSYRGGQEPIVHLEADLLAVIAWANANSQPWAFSLSNAGAFYAEFRSSIDELDHLDWGSIHNPDFQDRSVKESKQAEFLLYEHFPLFLVEHIGVSSKPVLTRATQALLDSSYRPPVSVLRSWYY